MKAFEPDREQYGEQSVDPENQLQPEDTLNDRGLEDALDEGYSPPEREPAHLRTGTTREEQRTGVTLDERLAAEIPEVDPYDRQSPADPGVPDPRAGRLVAGENDAGRDREQVVVAEDIGIDGAGASAEEAAVHLIDSDVGPEVEPD